MYISTHIFLMYIYKIYIHLILILTEVIRVVLCFWNHNPNDCFGGIVNLGASLLRMLLLQREAAQVGIPFLCIVLQMCFALRPQATRGGEKGWTGTNPLNVTGHWLRTCQCSEEANWIMIIAIGKMTKQYSLSYKFDYLSSCGHVWVKVGEDNICVCA